ncbi:hypothetical protein [Vibrio barjaei]|uniref:hypothetical protein n=1 Tax=Vibrio barjaei TaxID=1676683 RepID=UPI0022838B87|nr:hypothetical protein [Vibrio barjaei]MCY9874591.1 hypothetical protein [Vibrio barjaei]
MSKNTVYKLMLSTQFNHHKGYRYFIVQEYETGAEMCNPLPSFDEAYKAATKIMEKEPGKYEIITDCKRYRTIGRQDNHDDESYLTIARNAEEAAFNMAVKLAKDASEHNPDLASEIPFYVEFVVNEDLEELGSHTFTIADMDTSLFKQ